MNGVESIMVIMIDGDWNFLDGICIMNIGIENCFG